MEVLYALVLSAMVQYTPANKSSIYVTMAVFADEAVCERNITILEKTLPSHWAPIVWCEELPVIRDSTTSKQRKAL